MINDNRQVIILVVMLFIGIILIFEGVFLITFGSWQGFLPLLFGMGMVFYSGVTLVK